MKNDDVKNIKIKFLGNHDKYEANKVYELSENEAFKYLTIGIAVKEEI
jgi:hypothetical protein